MAENKPFTGIDDREKLAEVVPLSVPFTLNIFPSNVCNFKCNYCAQSLGADTLLDKYDFPMELMELQIIDKIINQSKWFEKKYKLVSFMGHGEPLCNRQLPEMIRRVKEAQIAERVDVITNAFFLDKFYADELVAAGLDVIRISLQGVSARSYKEICNVDINFDDFVKNLTYFYKNKKQCKIYMKTVDTSLAYGEEETFYNIFSPISDRIYIDYVKPVYSGVKYTDIQKDLSKDRYGNAHAKRLVCPQPFYMMSVWANGDVTPCDALYKACVLGNVRNKTLREMWLSPEKKEFCKIHLKKQRGNIPSCRECVAPDDVAAKEDILDDDADKLLAYFI